MARTSLAALPAEILHIVASSLPFRNLLLLRLVCRSLGAKVSSSRRFERRFAARTTDLSTASLETLAAIAAHPILGGLVHEVTLVTSFLDDAALRAIASTGKKPPTSDDERRRSDSDAVSRSAPWADATPAELAAAREALLVYDQLRADRARSAAAGQDLKLLAAAFASLRALRTLRLEASVFRSRGEPRGREMRLHVLRALDYLPAAEQSGQPSSPSGDERDGTARERQQKTQRRQIWEMATHDFRIALQAMAQSGMAIDRLLVFGKSWGCSVLSAEVGALLANDSMWGFEVVRAAVSRLKTLRISVSRGSLGMFGGGEEKRSAGWGCAAATDGPDGVGDMLSMAVSLEELDIRKVRAYNELGLSRTVLDPNFFGSIAARAAGEKLRSLTLRGWTARQEDLARLLSRCADLELLTLREMRLSEGQWTPVFRLLSEQAKRLKQVTLYRCFETQLIRVTRPAETAARTGDACYSFMGTVKLSGDEVRAGVEYCKQAETWTGSRPHRVYRRERMKEYGF